MAILSLPVFGDGRTSFRYTIALDGAFFVFDLNYMERHGSWYLTIRDRTLNTLRAGIRIIVGWPLLARDVDERLPAGLLIALRLDNLGDTPPKEDAFDGRVSLLLLTDEDADLAQPAESSALRIVPVLT